MHISSLIQSTDIVFHSYIVANDMQKFPHLCYYFFVVHKNQQAAINAEKCEQHVQIAAQKI